MPRLARGIERRLIQAGLAHAGMAFDQERCAAAGARSVEQLLDRRERRVTFEQSRTAPNRSPATVWFICNRHGELLGCTTQITGALTTPGGSVRTLTVESLG